VKKALPAEALGKEIELWFQDEARIGQKGTLTRIWAKKGTRPRVKRDQRYTCAYIFGAVCPARDIGAALVMPYADTEAMNKHLVEISKNVRAGAHAVIIMDGAGWHISKGIVVPHNLTLLPLPPYSPELNAQENIWQYLRQNYLAGRIFDSFEEIREAASAAWKTLIDEKGRIKSIASRDWLNWKTS
jgi:transposase